MRIVHRLSRASAGAGYLCNIETRHPKYRWAFSDKNPEKQIVNHPRVCNCTTHYRLRYLIRYFSCKCAYILNNAFFAAISPALYNSHYLSEKYNSLNHSQGMLCVLYAIVSFFLHFWLFLFMFVSSLCLCLSKNKLTRIYSLFKTISVSGCLCLVADVSVCFFFSPIVSLFLGISR